MEELANKIKEVRRIHKNQLNQLDLNLETAPRDSRYSQQLLEMMKKEELLLTKEPSSPATRVVTAKVDEGLKNETQAFFCKLVTQNIRKWDMLKDKLSRIRAQLNNEVSTKQQQYSSFDPIAAPLSIIELEEDRLLADYYKNWLNYEGFHLNQAFQSQQSRIDNDWSTHEKSLQQEFSIKRSAVVGTSYVDNSHDDANNKVDDNRWQHPEKQKTLIHTAPVFTPVRPTSARKSSTLKKKDNSHNNAELERIEKEYKEALASLQLQKADAKRWLTRQQVRLNLQCEEANKEKQFQFSILDDYIREINTIQNSLLKKR